MSIEIEVGLENAARAPKITELMIEEPPKTGLANPKVRQLLMLGGVVVLAAVLGLGAALALATAAIDWYNAKWGERPLPGHPEWRGERQWGK